MWCCIIVCGACLSSGPRVIPPVAGTALGDPIEVGALAAVVSRALNSRVPATELATAKALFGHTETAAGAVGMFRLCGRMAQHRRCDVLHLTTPNPYVAGVLEGTAAGSFTAARQPAPGLRPGGSSDMHVAGASAFAFQGTNAHALLASTSADVPRQPAATVAPWRRSRHWYEPPASAVLLCVAGVAGGGSDSVTFEVALGRPCLAFLWDHQVGRGQAQAGQERDSKRGPAAAAQFWQQWIAGCPQPPCTNALSAPLQVQGRVLVPGAAMYEVSRAAAQLLVDGAKSGGVAALTGISIPAPLLLPTGGSCGDTVLPSVRCTVSHAHGGAPNVRLQSVGGSTSRASATNISAHVCRLVQPAPAAAPTTIPAAITAVCRVALARVAAAPLSTARAANAAPAACSTLELRGALAAPGFHCHPAAVDAATHCGIFAVPEQRQPGTAARPVSLRLPAGAALFQASHQGSAGGACWPVMHDQGSKGDASRVSFEMLAGSRSAGGSGASCLGLHQLLLKPLRSSPAAPDKQVAAGAAADVGQQRGVVRYSVQHAVHLAAAAADSSRTAHGPAARLGGSGGSLAVLSKADRPAAVWSGAQRALRYLQQHGSTSVQLAAVLDASHVMAPSPPSQQDDSSAAVAGAVLGLLKGVAAEGGALAGARTRSCLAAVVPWPAHPAGDAYAVPHLLQSAWLLRELCSAVPAAAAVPAASKLASGSTVTISGGMGALGLLVAGWLAGAESSGAPAAVTLWGRAATAPLPPALLASGQLVTARQCDVASAADVAGGSTAARHTDIYMHAGVGVARVKGGV